MVLVENSNRSATCLTVKNFRVLAPLLLILVAPDIGGRTQRLPKPVLHPLIKPVRRVEGDPAGATEDRPTVNNGELGEPIVGAGSDPGLPNVLGGGLAAFFPLEILCSALRYRIRGKL
jgi:hypothetical protein